MSTTTRCPPRTASCQHEYGIMLAVIIVVCITAISWLGRNPASAVPSTETSMLLTIYLWCVGGALVAALLIWLGFCVMFVVLLVRARGETARSTILHEWGTVTVLCFLGAGLLSLLLPVFVVCAPLWLTVAASEGISRLRRSWAEQRLTRLRKLVAGRAAPPGPRHLHFAVSLLGDRHEAIRQEALRTVASLLRGNPTLVPHLDAPSKTVSPRTRIAQAFEGQLGFARALREARGPKGPTELVTLGAKLGAGTAEKRVSPATCDPAALARWLHVARGQGGPLEVQVSIGYDTGPLPSQVDRAKFLALYLFISSTDLNQFQALTRRPTRDPSAAHGLLIRGDRVEVHWPGQVSGKRLDYVFTFPGRLSERSLAEFLQQLQLLNVGMLLAVLEESHRAFFPGTIPPGMDTRLRAAAAAYRGFERRFVGLLREYDAHRDPRAIFTLDPTDHRERQEAFGRCRLETCLYPRYAWVVPLYGEDDSWDLLLPSLRCVEAMMLHQGPVDGKPVTRGQAFIQAVRLLGYQAAGSIAEALAAAEPAVPLLHADPFIDPAHEEETTEYLREMSRCLRAGQVAEEALPDLARFRAAAAYYRVTEANALT